MPKKLIKRFLPDHEKVRSHPHLNKLFGPLLHDPNLLHLNRRSVSGAFFIGLFMAFVPMPFQMVPAAAMAIYFRTNLIIAVALVWISNPITIPPMAYFCYKVGALIMDVPVEVIEFNLTWEWIVNELGAGWKPFILGCFVVGVTASLIGGFGIRLLWRVNVVRQWQARKLARARQQNQL